MYYFTLSIVRSSIGRATCSHATGPEFNTLPQRVLVLMEMADFNEEERKP